MSIKEAVEAMNQNIGINLDDLPRHGLSSILDGHSLVDYLKILKQQHPLVASHIKTMLGDYPHTIIKSAIKAHPDCEFLYLWYVSPHRSSLGSKPEVRRRYTELFGHQALHRLRKRLYFSPLLQISIGHWHHLINTIRVASILNGGCPPITVFTSSVDSGITLIDYINDLGLAAIEVADHEEILAYPLSKAIDLYNCDYYLSAIASHVECDLQKQFTYVGGKSGATNKVFLHLRTHTYKNDGHSYHASIRNVDPISYLGAISHLQIAERLEPVLVTADLDMQECLPIHALKVRGRETERRQWSLVREAAFSIGTASGLSHLFNLGIGHTFRTNSNGLAMDDFFTDRHLIACKRFEIKDPTHIDLCVHELAYVICLPWEITNGLASFSIINDLTHDELIKATLEFLNIYHGARSPHTLYNLFERLGLMMLTSCIPNRNIARSTAQDIERALRMSKTL